MENEYELINNEHLKRAIETIFTQNRRPTKPINNEYNVIATQECVDYEK